MKNNFIKFLNALYKMLIFIIKLLFSLLFFLLICGWTFIVIVYSKDDILNWQIILYILFSIFNLFTIWVFMFTKIKYKFVLIFLFIVWFFLPKFLPNVMKVFDIDSCLDTGLCREGIINMQDNEGNSIPINKENCLKYGYTWYEEDKSCNLRKNK